MVTLLIIAFYLWKEKDHMQTQVILYIMYGKISIDHTFKSIKYVWEKVYCEIFKGGKMSISHAVAK